MRRRRFLARNPRRPEPSRRRTTLRALVDEALRDRLARRGAAGTFRLKRHPFKGKGRSPHVPEGQWDAVRDLIYRIG